MIIRNSRSLRIRNEYWLEFYFILLRYIRIEEDEDSSRPIVI